MFVNNTTHVTHHMFLQVPFASLALLSLMSLLSFLVLLLLLLLANALGVACTAS